MNTNFKFIRFAFALMIALGAIGFSASAALAAPPQGKDVSFTVSLEIDNLCSFPVDIQANVAYHETVFFDNYGVLTKTIARFTEQDIFTGPSGKTLVGNLYHNSQMATYDSDGNVLTGSNNGVQEQIRLPQGGIIFISAGRANWLNPPETGFADPGNPGDVAALCTALAP
jgi:hypothetical protein